MAVTLEINIRQEDIDDGIPGDASACAIARRLDGLGFENVSVNDETIDVNGEEIECPKRAANFIDIFDENEEREIEFQNTNEDREDEGKAPLKAKRRLGKPFKFRIRLPEAVIESMQLTKELKSLIVKCDRKLRMTSKSA